MASEFYDPTLTSSPQIKTTEIKVFSNNNQTYREKQKIIIQIPKEVQFIDPANTRLLVKLDFNNDLTGQQLTISEGNTGTIAWSNVDPGVSNVWVEVDIAA